MEFVILHSTNRTLYFNTIFIFVREPSESSNWGTKKTQRPSSLNNITSLLVKAMHPRGEAWQSLIKVRSKK